jgi:ATPase, YjeE family
MIHSKYISQNLSDLEKLVKELAPLLNEGGVMTLNGQIGAGKTTFAKLIIQELTQIPLEDIVSPTFNLYHTYNKDTLEIAHYDFYRIESEMELLEIDLNESITNKICIIEWADKFRDLLPKDRIEIFIKYTKNERVYRINPLGKFREVVSNLAKIENFLGGLDINFTELQRLPGDASNRQYYRVMSSDNNMILMDATQESVIKRKAGQTNGIDDFIHIREYLDSIDVKCP